MRATRELRAPAPRGVLGLLGALIALIGLLAGCSALPLSPADHIRAALVATRVAGTAGVTVSSRTAVLGQNVDLNGTGVLDLAHQTADLTVQVPVLGGPVRTLIANGILYAQVPAGFALFVPGAKPWVSINLDRLTQQQFGASLTQLGLGGSSNPLTQLGYLQGIQDAREIGPEPVGGTPTTHYAATIDLERTPAAQDPATRPAVQRLESQLGSPSLPVDVWIDDSGRLRQVAQTLQAAPAAGTPAASDPTHTSQTTTITVTGFGVPGPMSPPPPDQVTDLAQLLPTG
jgi:hypothetical protein